MQSYLACLTAILGTLTLINAGVVTYMTYQQFRLSKEKLKLDLFDRRFAVYRGVHTFLTRIVQAGRVDMQDVAEFWGITHVATFLFGEEIPVYIKEIEDKSNEAYRVNEEFRGMAVGSKRDALISHHTELLEWFRNQRLELTNRFAQYLRFKAWV